MFGVLSDKGIAVGLLAEARGVSVFENAQTGSGTHKIYLVATGRLLSGGTAAGS
jgi:hypothetical protein